jgi:hypothetical protein
MKSEGDFVNFGKSRSGVENPRKIFFAHGSLVRMVCMTSEFMVFLSDGFQGDLARLVDDHSRFQLVIDDERDWAREWFFELEAYFYICRPIDQHLWVVAAVLIR